MKRKPPVIEYNDKLKNTEPDENEIISPKKKRKPLVVNDKTLEKILGDVEYEIIVEK